MFLYFYGVTDEYSLDAFHKNGDRIYVVTSQEYIYGEVTGSYDTPGMLGEELTRVMPEIEFAFNYVWNQYYTLSTGDKKMKVEGNFAGKDFFKIFSYPLIQGTTETALKSPQSIAISEKMATNFFGSSNAAIKKIIRLRIKRSESNRCICGFRCKQFRAI